MVVSNIEGIRNGQVCVFCSISGNVSISACGSERADHCLPRPAHLLFSFKLLGFSYTEEVVFRNACASH